MTSSFQNVTGPLVLMEIPAASKSTGLSVLEQILHLETLTSDISNYHIALRLSWLWIHTVLLVSDVQPRIHFRA